MSKVLILSSFYLGAATANGICAKNIAKEFTQNGDTVYVLCYDKGDKTDNVYTVSCPVSKTATTFAAKACGLLRTFIKPQLNQTLVDDYTKAALQICREKNIDTVVSMFFPCETVPVLQAVKMQLPEITTVIYELDSVGNGISAGSKYQTLINNATKRWCNRQYGYADKVIVMQTHEDYWKSTFGKKHGHRLRIADIPVLTKRSLPQVEKPLDAPVNFLYGGLIEQAYRSPDYLLAVFETYTKQKKAELHFFSKGDCETKIADAAKRIGGIFQHGYVPEAELDQAIAKADVLLSIGNSVSRSVPSKLITYLAYGKPVVHFSSQKDDVCIQYLEKYDLGLVLCEWDAVEENVQKLQSFVKKTRGKTVAFSHVEKAFAINTPVYSARLISDDV